MRPRHRYLHLRFIEDRLPVVTVTMSDGEVITVAPVVLTDEAADALYVRLRAALTGCVVRRDSIPRAEFRELSVSR